MLFSLETRVTQIGDWGRKFALFSNPINFRGRLGEMSDLIYFVPRRTHHLIYFCSRGGPGPLNKICPPSQRAGPSK